MEEQFVVRPGNFLRPKQREADRGGERFLRVLKKALRFASSLLLLLLFLLAGHWVYVTLLEDTSFRMRKIEVVGCQKIPQETLLSLTQVEGMPNLFTLPLKEIARRIESHPWIEEVRLRKVFPDRMLIQVEERKPIAILQLDDLYYIDQKGVIFSRVGEKDEYDYPFLTGLSRSFMGKNPEEAKGLITRALELLMIVEKEKTPPLEDVSEIRMEKATGLQCVACGEDLEVKMGWDDYREKVKRLAILWSDLQKRGYSAALIDCSDLKRMVAKGIPKRLEVTRR